MQFFFVESDVHPQIPPNPPWEGFIKNEALQKLNELEANSFQNLLPS